MSDAHALGAEAQRPQRRYELLAAKIVGAWVGDSGIVTDTGSGHGPDFRIDYEDGRLGLGEVGWYEDPEVRSMWAAIHRQSTPQIIELPPGSGHWSADLSEGCSIRNLVRDLPKFVEELIAAGMSTSLDPVKDFDGRIYRLAAELGISEVRLFDPAGPDGATYFPPGDGGWIPDDPNIIVDWIEMVIADENYQDTTQKLLKLPTDERHVFLVTGSSRSTAVNHRLETVGDLPPERSPALPEGITHIWIMSLYRFVPAHAAVWSASAGWKVVLIPEDEK